MFNEYFNHGLYIYLLGSPALFYLAMISLRYFALTYEPTLDEMRRFIHHSSLKLLVTLINEEKIYNYVNNPYDVSLGRIRNGRFFLTLWAILIEVAILQILLDTTNLDQKLLPTVFWSVLYVVSFILCWRFGSRLKKYVG